MGHSLLSRSTRSRASSGPPGLGPSRLRPDRLSPPWAASSLLRSACIRSDRAAGREGDRQDRIPPPLMTYRSSRLLVFILLVCSIGLLIPGLFAPVLTIRGVLTRDGIAQVAPMMLERGLSDETIAVLKSMMNPSIVGFLEATGSDLRKIIIERLTPQITAALQKSVSEVEVYSQTRSIVGSVRRLYEVGSPVPATLILLFSVIVPLGKAALVAWAVFMTDAARRRRTVRFVEAIAKWSMADVFVVALFIAY